MDTISKKRRSWNMSRIRSKDTKPEKAVRSLLHKLGYRFRIHNRKLPGNPDIILKQFKTAIFVHGCFWHRHKGCKYAYTPKSRIQFWNKKFSDNLKRHREVTTELKKMGWNIIIIWECQTKNIFKLQLQLHRKLKTLFK
ncbi:MAG: DNA mismatch endonuclease Vsr [Endomicrobiales bacterium]|nr:DNA mismatch endonuclease Vsr [Endomicrobiales bacterium]